jgi:ABC-type cobalt transport system substrate-binding protein
LPTALPPIRPRPRRVTEKRSLARIVFDVVFNTALVVSALMLTFVVLVRQEQYAFGQQPRADQTIEQIEPATQDWDMTGETMVTPPSD